MARNAQARSTSTNVNPTKAKGASDKEAGTLPTLDIGKGMGKRPSLIASAIKHASELAAMKAQARSAARQKLAFAADLYREGGEKTEEATKAIAEAGLELYRLRINGAMTIEEMNAELGDIFGYKRKKGLPGAVAANDPEASKTPYGQAEALRKRIVRALQAHDHVAGGDGGSFFEGLAPDASDADDNYTLAGVVRAVEEGKLSLYSAYDYFAAIKRAQAEKVDAAFSPRAIAKLMSQLRRDGAVETYRKSPELVQAYADLVQVIMIMDEAAAAKNAEEAEQSATKH